jgi:hypothetical protein
VVSFMVEWRHRVFVAASATPERFSRPQPG